MLFEDMYIVMSSKDGPVAGSYTRAVADTAARNLRVLYPGTRMWIVPGTAAEIQQKELEVLACPIDAEITTAHRVLYEGTVRTEYVRRLTLRGLVDSNIRGSERRSQGEGWTSELAESHAAFARATGVSEHRVRFTF
ncbi:hypothetical protein GCM10008957_27740 [Deinococcus ruber]|uniref:Uncharacterized protein n=2 Tax=Deinococcus ruber TaxID=1848197 RepID=A0A918C9Y0_9DEIO|nr:hypothetical protein GCM10008957_27740 [Deinococcus ruber]